MHKIGTLYFAEQFIFLDGSSSRKYIILISDPKYGYICCKLTSNDTHYDKSIGCQINTNDAHYFYCPANTISSNLNKDSFIQLHEFYQYSEDDFNRKCRYSEFEVKDVLNVNYIKDIILCASKSDDINDTQSNILMNTYNDIK